MQVDKCGEDQLTGAYQSRGLTDCARGYMSLGAFFGLLISQKFAPGIISGTPENPAFSHKLARFVTGILLFTICHFLRELVTKATINNIYAQLYLEVIPELLLGLSLFLFGDLMNRRFGLLRMEVVTKDGQF